MCSLLLSRATEVSPASAALPVLLAQLDPVVLLAPLVVRVLRWVKEHLLVVKTNLSSWLTAGPGKPDKSIPKQKHSVDRRRWDV